MSNVKDNHGQETKKENWPCFLYGMDGITLSHVIQSDSSIRDVCELMDAEDGR